MSPCHTISFFFFFNDTATTEIYTLFPTRRSSDLSQLMQFFYRDFLRTGNMAGALQHAMKELRRENRSEEHTSELQSRSDLVCRLLLEKKKKRRPRLPQTSLHRLLVSSTRLSLAIS